MRPVILALLALLMAPSAPAEDTASDTISSQARIDLTPFTVAPEVPASFAVPFKITNTSQRDLTVTSFRAKFLVPSGAELAGASGAKDENACEEKQITLPPGGETILFCEFSPALQINSPIDLAQLAWHWRTLTMRPGDYQLFAIAEFSGKDESDLEFRASASTIAHLKLRPSIWQVLLGVGFGALLLTIFRLWSPDASHLRGAGRTGFLRKLVLFFSLWFSAWISGSMLVFITYRMQDSSFPITLAVNDFYGGVVVGIFSYVAAQWLAEKVLIKAERALVEQAGDASQASQGPNAHKTSRTDSDSPNDSGPGVGDSARAGHGTAPDGSEA